MSLIKESLDCKNCILKILNVQFNSFHYVLTTDTKGYVNFWDVSKYIENSQVAFMPKSKYCLHQSGINCCHWLEFEDNFSLLATGGDDQCLNLSVFHHKDILTLLCNVAITIHSSQVTGNFFFLIHNYLNCFRQVLFIVLNFA